MAESNSMCLKRKLIDSCLSKECKSRRIKAENGPSSDPSTKRCHCCCTRPNLASDCVNYLKSGVPSRIMFYKQGSWHNFPEQIMKSLIGEFRGNKSSFVVVMDGEPLLVDFLSMTLVNLKTRKQRSVAWFDDNGKFFLPSVFFDEEADELAKVGAGNVEGTVQGIMLDKAANSPPEVVKQVVLESSSPIPQKPSNADLLRKKITCLERSSEDFLFVQDIFLSGMGPFATPNNILHIHRYSPNDITAQCKIEAFERQMRCTREERGDANVRYAWLGSRKNDIVRILINGFGSTRKPAEKAGLSSGVYLSPEDRAFSSIGLCDVDEKGVQYMLLFRVILGNTEAVKPGSQDLFPTSDIYDSGVDDCSNPKCYVMWPSHLSTHVRLEYLVSFRLAPKVRNYLLGLKGLWFHSSPKEVTGDISTLQPVMCETGQGPTSPWISFRVLFAIIQDNISSVARELLFHHYEEMQERKITRQEMVKMMIIIVGEKLLLETLKKLHYCPSLWYKPSVEVVSADPSRTAAEQLLDKTGTSSSLTLCGSNNDSDEPNAVAENSAALSTKGCGTLATGVVRKDHNSLAPSIVPEPSTSAGAVCRDSPGVEHEGKDSSMQIISPGTSATHCVRNKDTFVARMAPIVRDVLLRTIPRKSASPGLEVCNSVARSTGPAGGASLGPINALKSNGILSPDFTPKGCETLVPSLALGNSSTGVKRLNSAPRMTPEGQEFLSLSLTSQSPALCSDKGRSTHLVHAPGNVNQSSLNTEGCDALALSIAPKRHVPVSWNEPEPHKSPPSDRMLASQQSEASSVSAEGNNAPTPAAGVSGVRDELAVTVPDSSSNITEAAVTLVALSTPGEKGRY